MSKEKESQNIKELVRLQPNDQDLGRLVRELIDSEGPVDITGLSNIHYKGAKILNYHFEMILFNLLNHN